MFFEQIDHLARSRAILPPDVDADREFFSLCDPLDSHLEHIPAILQELYSPLVLAIKDIFFTNGEIGSLDNDGLKLYVMLTLIAMGYGVRLDSIHLEAAHEISNKFEDRAHRMLVRYACRDYRNDGTPMDWGAVEAAVNDYMARRAAMSVIRVVRQEPVPVRQAPTSVPTPAPVVAIPGPVPVFVPRPTWWEQVDSHMEFMFLSLVAEEPTIPVASIGSGYTPTELTPTQMELTYAMCEAFSVHAIRTIDPAIGDDDVKDYVSPRPKAVPLRTIEVHPNTSLGRWVDHQLGVLDRLMITLNPSFARGQAWSAMANRLPHTSCTATEARLYLRDVQRCAYTLAYTYLITEDIKVARGRAQARNQGMEEYFERERSRNRQPLLSGEQATRVVIIEDTQSEPSRRPPRWASF